MYKCTKTPTVPPAATEGMEPVLMKPYVPPILTQKETQLMARAQLTSSCESSNDICDSFNASLLRLAERSPHNKCLIP